MIKRIVIVVIAIFIPFLGRGLFFYSGFYSPPTVEMPSYEQIVVPAAPSTDFSDTYEKGEGTILIDLAHDNAFDIEELDVLILRLISRGLTIEFFSKGDDLQKELLGEEGKKEDELEEGEKDQKEDELEEGEKGQKEDELEEELVVADAFIIVCPQVEFSQDEREAVGSFVENTGKLLLIGDPTRTSEMNSISLKFGLIFEPGYLYNMKENDANYRNIFVTEFKNNEITKDLTRIALYTAGAITSIEGGIAFVDENTFSSVIETRVKLSPVAQASDSKVLGIYDLTFLTEPYNGIVDNNRLISNIADWLAIPVEEKQEEEASD